MNSFKDQHRDVGYVGEDCEVDDVEADLAAEEANDPGYPPQAMAITALLEVLFQLRQRRLALGLTLEEIARRTGDTSADLARAEDNDVDVSADMIRRYASAVGLALEYRLIAS